jgi:TetR/AcrR family transcriptional regulator, repressor for neighboring sulfatase
VATRRPPTTTANVSAAPTRGRPPAREGAPHGEQAVRSSLIAAATELFADRGPRAVSVREIAEAAGVNHGLVHHYFGSKDGLVTAVLDELSAGSLAEMASHELGSVVFVAGGPTERHGRILAHLLLDGADPRDYKSGFPTVEALIATYRNEGFSAREAKVRAAQVAAMVLGWQFFEPFLTAAAGLEVSDKTRQRLLDDAVTRLSQR